MIRSRDIKDKNALRQFRELVTNAELYVWELSYATRNVLQNYSLNPENTETECKVVLLELTRGQWSQRVVCPICNLRNLNQQNKSAWSIG